MKKDIVILAIAALFAGSALLHSEDAAAKTPLQTLQDIKTANATLLDAQKKTWTPWTTCRRRRTRSRRFRRGARREV